MAVGYAGQDSLFSPIRRITEGRQRWRVMVEAWPERDAFQGRLVFRTEGAAALAPARESAALLHGRTAEDVVSLAYDLPEERLRRVLHSLS